jgi:threonine 3-dehydrogenase
MTMKTFCKVDPKYGGEFVNKPIPTCADDEVLIRVVATSICGTDVHIYEWNDWAKSRIPVPQTMGHEFVGKIVKVGKFVSGYSIGETVVAETHIVCNTCEFCVNNKKHICENAKVLGVDTDGAFAEYIAIPSQNAIKVNPVIEPEFLSILEPLGNAVHTVNSTNVDNKTVAIVGCGPIGLMAIDVARANKAKKVFAIEVNEYRLNKAKELGADAVINPLSENVKERIMELTDGRGVDVVCEMSGKESAITDAFSYIKAGGHFAMLGVPSGSITINVATDIVFKGITIQGITGRRMFETWDQMKYLLDADLLHLDKIVTHKLPFDQLEDGMNLMESGNCGKVVLFMPKETSNE